MKNIYLVLQKEMNNKYYASVEKIPTGSNIKAVLDRNDIEIAHLCESKKQAEETAKSWNDCYKKNGTSVYL